MICLNKILNYPLIMIAIYKFQINYLNYKRTNNYELLFK
jgi:hypothetical protein